MRVSEIRVKRIRVNQGLGVLQSKDNTMEPLFNLLGTAIRDGQ